MKKQILLLACFIAGLAVLGWPARLSAQHLADSVKWRIPISAWDRSNSGPSARSTAKYALQPSAHYGPPYDVLGGFTDRWTENSSPIDTETDWPPLPPGTFVDFKNPRAPLLNSYQVTMIHPYTGPTQIDSARFEWKSDGIANVDTTGQVLTWPSPTVLRHYADSIFLTYTASGVEVLKINLTRDSSYTYIPSGDTNLSSGPMNLGNMRLVVVHPKPAPLPPDSVIGTYPPPGAQGIATADSLKWQATPTFDGLPVFYRVQLASDRTFKTASIILRDSLQATARAFTGLTPATWYYWRVKAFTPFGVGIYKTVADSFYTGIPVPKINLVSPAKGQVNVPVTPKLIWNKFAFGTMTYHVQVSSFAGFSPLLVDSSLTDTTLTVTQPLTNCDTIFWRVHGSNEGGTGPDTTSYFKVLYAAPGAPVALLLPDSATNTDVNNLRFSWSGRDICTDDWRLQISTDSTFGVVSQTLVVTDTTAVASNLIGLTTYYWRVRAENGSLQSAYTTRRMFTTKLAAPFAPVPVSPATGSTLAGVSGTMVWKKALNNPNNYRVELSADPQVKAPWIVVDSTLTDTSKPFGPLPGCSTFYWHVLAMNDSGQSAFCAVQSFKTPQTVPDTVRLISPADKATNQPQNTTLTWAATGACPTTKFILDVSVDSLFGTVALHETLTVTSTVFGPLTSNTLYYWRVAGWNSTGAGQAIVHSFRATALTKPDTAVLKSPPNGIGGVPLNPTLVWDSTARATSWRLQLAYDNAFTELIVDDSTLHSPSKQVGPLLDSTWYYWRVNASNDSGTGPYSRPFSFYTMAPPGSITLVKPLNNQVDVGVVPTFFWTLPSGTQYFQLEVSADSNFTNFIFNDTSLTTTNYTINVWLKGFTWYYWRVRARNSAGWGAFTPFWAFRTARVGAANWFMPLAMAETGPQHDTIFMGVHPIATFGIDPALGELELPQPPPPGNFDFRFIDIPSRPNLLGAGLRVNLLPFIAYTQVDSFRISFQPGVGSYPMTLSWPQKFVKDICDSMVVTDEFGGSSVRKRMDIDSSVSISNIGVSTLLIVEYGAFPLGVKKERPQTPKGFTLAQNYPNPFNPTTRITFSNDQSAHVRLTVHDVLGREVATLVAGDLTPGVWSVTWDGRNSSGSQMPSGVYYLRMSATAFGAHAQGGTPFVSTRKMILMK